MDCKLRFPPSEGLDTECRGRTLAEPTAAATKAASLSSFSRRGAGSEPCWGPLAAMPPAPKELVAQARCLPMLRIDHMFMPLAAPGTQAGASGRACSQMNAPKFPVNAGHPWRRAAAQKSRSTNVPSCEPHRRAC